MRKTAKSTALEEYEDWLFDIVDPERTHVKLLRYLLTKEFFWSVDHDENRNEDGFVLRWKFADEVGLNEDFWIDILPENSSVLEMLIALSMRVDDEIYDPRYRDRIDIWFWKIVNNIGLGWMQDKNFDEEFCDRIIERLLERQYKRDGEGGYFMTEFSNIDMRKAEIWYQMEVWIGENFEV